MHQKHLIFVTGGVMSGLGKGITTSSIGRLLISKGYSVSAMKIDPYINVDAGTMRPTEHGEVFVTEDGGEIDQDLGNYERFLHTVLSKEHNLTTGKVYQAVIERERRGDYLGKTVQPIPHITDEIKQSIMKAAEGKDILLIEVGGTVGDYENVLFLEAARQLKMELGPGKVLFVHVTYVPVLKSVGEAKTKPAQHSIKNLMSLGIIPDFLVCRSENSMDSVRLEKLALFCNVPKENIIINPDIDHVYRLPLLFEEQGFGKKILDRFGLEPKEDSLGDWRRISERFSKVKKSVRVGMIGKYINVGDFQLADSYVSVNEAIKHAAAELGAKAEIVWMNAADLEKDASRIDDVDCVIVPGGFGSSGIEGKINAIKYCRENDIPFLGLCLGLQMAVVEYARNVCGLNGAHSTEMDRKTAYPVIDILPEQKGVTKKGGTMRLGGYPAVLRKGSIVRRLYEEAGRMDGESAVERHRHRYEVNPDYIGRLQENGLVVSGLSPDGKLTEFIELPGHRYFVATQSHPEFTSWPGRPNPLFYGLIRAAIEK